MPTSHRHLRTMNRLAALAVGAVLATSFGAAAARGADPRNEAKVERQIGVMEKILDKVLVDSPNFLVARGGENTRGLYLEEVGALFTFEASLTSYGFDVKSYLRSLGSRFEVKTDDEGNQYIVIKKQDEKKEKHFEAQEKELEARQKELEEQARDLEAKEKQLRGQEKALEELDEGDAEETLALGREELVQTLLDYGETLGALDDGQWIIIAAFLPGHPRDEGISRLVMRARMGDLRAYSEGRLAEQEMRQRIRIVEN